MIGKIREDKKTEQRRKARNTKPDRARKTREDQRAGSSKTTKRKGNEIMTGSLERIENNYLSPI